jgi:hypothetical protein
MRIPTRRRSDESSARFDADNSSILRRRRLRDTASLWPGLRDVSYLFKHFKRPSDWTPYESDDDDAKYERLVARRSDKKIFRR